MKKHHYVSRTEHGYVRMVMRHSTKEHARHYDLPDVIQYRCPECGKFIPDSFPMLEFGLPGEIFRLQRYYCRSCGWADSSPKECWGRLGFAMGWEVVPL